MHLIDQCGRQNTRVVETAFQHASEHPPIPGTGDDRPDARPEHRREEDVGEVGAAPNAAPATVVIWIHCDHMGDPRVAPRREGQLVPPIESPATIASRNSSNSSSCSIESAK